MARRIPRLSRPFTAVQGMPRLQPPPQPVPQPPLAVVQPAMTADEIKALVHQDVVQELDDRQVSQAFGTQRPFKGLNKFGRQVRSYIPVFRNRAEAILAGPEAAEAGFMLKASETEIGDAGGAFYVRENSEPAHPFKINVGSQWFGIRSRIITPEFSNLADPTGDTSSDAAFEEVADYANQLANSDRSGRGLLINATGKYKLNDEHIFQQSDLTFDFQGRGILDLSASDPDGDAFAWGVLHFTIPAADRFGTRTTITENVDAGIWDLDPPPFVVADASGLAPGDAIAITSTGEYWNGIVGVGGYASSNKGELNFVQSISGNTITPAIPLKDSYLAETYTTYVRKVNLLKDITIKGLRALGSGGGNDHDTTNPTGVRTIDIECFQRFTIQDSFIENFPRFGGLSFLGYDLNLINTHVIGRKLDDSTNIPHTSQWFTGWVTGGVQGVNVTGCSARFARRLIDPDASATGLFDEDDSQTIPTRDVHIVGGNSYACVTGPAGHKYQGLHVDGHRIINCGTGIQHRGKDLFVTNVAATCEGGLTVGVGTIDASTYPETPSSGTIRIDNSEFICSQNGIYGVVAWDRCDISNTSFTARKPVELTGKAYPNWTCNNVEFNCTHSANPVIHDTYLPKTSISNWRFRHCIFQGGTYGLDILGSSGGASGNLIWDGCEFYDLSLRAIRFGATGSPLWGDRIIVKGSISDITISGISDGFGANVLEIGNDWVPLAKTLTLDAGTITVPDNIPTGYPIHFELATGGGAADLNTIAGGIRGQVLVLTSADGGDDVTVKNGADNILCGTDFTLTVPLDSITLMKIATDDWIAIGKQDNA